MHYPESNAVQRRLRRTARRENAGSNYRVHPQAERSDCAGQNQYPLQTCTDGGAGMNNNSLIEKELHQQSSRPDQTGREFVCIAGDVRLGKNVRLSKFINLYGCEIGDETKIGAFVEIQKNATVGRRCKISSHTFICEGVTIEDNVFVGHGVTFINDSYPRATTRGGDLQTEKDWKVERTVVSKGASIGSGVTILANVHIGENAIIGAGSMVTKDVPANAIVAGNPARFRRFVDQTVEVSE